MTGLEVQLGVFSQSLILPRDDVPYVSGTLVPIIGGPRADRSDPGGLRIPGSEPAEDDFIGTYVTLSEYVPMKGPYDLQSIADVHRRSALLLALVAVNRSSQHSDTYSELLQSFEASLLPPLRARFQSAMRIPTGGLGRRVVAPHPLLFAMRWVLGISPQSEPVEEGMNVLQAVPFVHAVADNLRDHPIEGSGDYTEEQKNSLMLVMMNLGTIGGTDDIKASIDRTVRLWNHYGERARSRTGSSATELLVQATGLEPEDFLAVGFALYAYAENWKPGQSVAINRGIHPDMPMELLEKCLSLLAISLDESLRTAGPPASDFDFLALESRPVVELECGLVVLDANLLWRRCTSGLFWMVHDWLRDQSARSASDFRHAYADMLEALVEDGLRALAPPALGGAQLFFTEEDLEVAYGQVSRCDAVVDFGEEVLLVEVVSGQLTVPARVKGDLDKLEEDFKKLVLDKCVQLDATARLLFADEEPLTGIVKGVRFPKFIPVLVVGGGFPLNQLSTRYVVDRLAKLELLNDPRIAPLCILDPEDVDHLEGLAERGHSIGRVLIGWKLSDLALLPLNNHLLREFHGIDRRPSRMVSVDLTFDTVKRRLGFKH
ncbi:MAG: hypothetical protein ABL953_09445 [Ilumatobacteraceae bacterium]